MLALVTGGAGVVGAKLVQRLRNEGHDTAVIDDYSSEGPHHLPAGTEVFRVDISDGGALAGVIEGVRPDWIFHLAASFANELSIDDPRRDLTVNGLGTLLLVQHAALSAHRKLLKRVIYTSTSCVYGSCSQPISESAAISPTTPYAASKFLGESYLAYFCRSHGVPAVTLRLFNCYGPGEYPLRRRGVVPRFIAAALAGTPLVVTGTGRETRDFTYVEDVVDAMLAAAIQPTAVGKTYNVGTGNATSIAQLAEMIITTTRSESRIEYSKRRSWDHIPHRCADIQLAARDLGFRGSTPLGEGLAATIEWLREAASGAASDGALSDAARTQDV